jgi:heme/copper-type cytochrome/quinol oxidase subunit 2
MLDQGSDTNLNPPTQPAPEEKSNRTFMIAVGILGGLVFITIICVLVYAFVIGPRLSANNASAQATAEAHNAQIADAMTATMMASLWTPTELPTSLPEATQTPSPTPVVNIPTDTPTSIYDPLTATMAALYTQAAIAQLTPTSTLTAPETLPQGGFADKYGLPGLILMAAVLVVIIFLARRLRVAPLRQK